jgi:hypothetical protein
MSVAYIAHTTILSIALSSLHFTEEAVLLVLLIICVVVIHFMFVVFRFQHCALSTSPCNLFPSQKKCLGNF